MTIKEFVTDTIAEYFAEQKQSIAKAMAEQIREYINYKGIPRNSTNGGGNESIYDY